MLMVETRRFEYAVVRDVTLKGSSVSGLFNFFYSPKIQIPGPELQPWPDAAVVHDDVHNSCHPLQWKSTRNCLEMDVPEGRLFVRLKRVCCSLRTAVPEAARISAVVDH